jgi:hypothetical protein
MRPASVKNLPLRSSSKASSIRGLPGSCRSRGRRMPRRRQAWCPGLF